MDVVFYTEKKHVYVLIFAETVCQGAASIREKFLPHQERSLTAQGNGKYHLSW